MHKAIFGARVFCYNENYKQMRRCLLSEDVRRSPGHHMNGENAMSGLDNLNLVSETKPTVTNPVIKRRERLVAKIDHQRHALINQR